MRHVCVVYIKKSALKTENRGLANKRNCENNLKKKILEGNEKLKEKKCRVL